jgi:hypothetical protein
MYATVVLFILLTIMQGGGVAVAALMVWGVYAFVFDKKSS